MVNKKRKVSCGQERKKRESPPNTFTTPTPVFQVETVALHRISFLQFPQSFGNGRIGGTDTPSPNLPFDNDHAVVFPHATPVLRDCRTHAQPDTGGAGVPRLATLDLRSRPSLGADVPNGTLLPRAFAGVRGTTFRGPCVPPSGTAASRVPGSAASDFASPRTNPFSLFQRPLRGVRGRQPPRHHPAASPRM